MAYKQAPVAPPAPKMSYRAKALARIADPTLPRKVHRADNTVTDAFLHSKRDKHLIRKASFRARVADKRADLVAASGRGGVGGASKTKRRRPSKKLITTLQSLADALPEVNDDDGDDDKKDEASGGRSSRNHRRSLRTRPGSLKRKEKVVKAEMARFGLNLAQLTAIKEEAVAVEEEKEADGDGGMEVEDEATKTAQPTAPAAPPQTKQSTANRFALLQSYIKATMEQSPAFAKPSTAE